VVASVLFVALVIIREGPIVSLMRKFFSGFATNGGTFYLYASSGGSMTHPARAVVFIVVQRVMHESSASQRKEHHERKHCTGQGRCSSPHRNGEQAI
jgi:hypothetical protein